MQKDKQKPIGKIIKAIIDCRNKQIKEVAAAMGIKDGTFSAQLINDTLTVDTLFRLVAYLDIDLEWLCRVLGYFGEVSPLEQELIPRMKDIEFREAEKKKVYQSIDRLLNETMFSTTDTREELLKAYSHNMYYLLDVLINEDYQIKMTEERGKRKYYVDINDPGSGTGRFCGRRSPISLLKTGNQALDIVIEERKDEIHENRIL